MWTPDGINYTHESGARLISKGEGQFDLFEAGQTRYPWLLWWYDEPTPGWRGLVFHWHGNKPTATFATATECADDILERLTRLDAPKRPAPDAMDRLTQAVDAVLAQANERKDLVNWTMVPRDAINDLRRARVESER